MGSICTQTYPCAWLKVEMFYWISVELFWWLEIVGWLCCGLGAAWVNRFANAGDAAVLAVGNTMERVDS